MSIQASQNANLILSKNIVTTNLRNYLQKVCEIFANMKINV